MASRYAGLDELLSPKVSVTGTAGNEDFHRLAADEEGLAAQRASIAVASGGRSTDAVHAAVIREIECEQGAGAILDFGAGEGLLTRLLLASGRFDRVVAADLIPYDFPSEVESLIGD